MNTMIIRFLGGEHLKLKMVATTVPTQQKENVTPKEKSFTVTVAMKFSVYVTKMKSLTIDIEMTLCSLSGRS